MTLANASPPPTENGQNLAWSLGTIAGFDRASISITVNLPEQIASPAPVDTGATAYATLDAGTVTASTPAASLQPGNVSNAAILASTVDADTNDPYIQEAAAALDYDPTRIFDYLQTQVGYNSYLGSVRGARGTLWSGAGNSLDVASLGVALMRASGIPAQYAQGTLSQSQAQPLILRCSRRAPRSSEQSPQAPKPPVRQAIHSYSLKRNRTSGSSFKAEAA